MDAVHATSRHPGLQTAAAAGVVAAIIGGGMLLGDLPAPDLVRPSLEDSRRALGPQPPPAPRIRADYPLTAGWPDAGLARGPDRLQAPLALQVCGTALSVPSGGDRLRTTQVAPMGSRDRELHTYATQEVAREAYVALHGSYRACTDAGGGGRTVYLARHSGFQVLGYDDAGIQVVTVIQFGKALIVAVEARAGSDLATAEAAAREQTQQLTEPVERLCEFAAEGCT